MSVEGDAFDRIAEAVAQWEGNEIDPEDAFQEINEALRMVNR